MREIEAKVALGGSLGAVNLLFSIGAAGNLAPESLVPPDVSAVDSEKLTDIYLVLEYKLRKKSALKNP